MTRFGMLWMAAGLLVGQLVGARPYAEASALVCAAGALLALRSRRAAGLALCVACAGIGIVQAAYVRSGAELPRGHVARHAGSRVHLRGHLAARPYRSGARLRLLVEVEAARRGGPWKTSRGRVRLTVAEAERPWRKGDGIAGYVRLREPHNFGNPGEFDYEAYLARRGVRVTAYARTDASFARTPAPAGWGGWLEEWRERVLALIDRSADGATADILATMVVGQRRIDAGVRRRYQRTGLSHVLAISGLHVGLIAALAYRLVRWLLSRSEWLLLHGNVTKLAYSSAMIPVLCYAGLAGATVPTVRALVMGGLVVVGILLDRQRHWEDVLTATVLVVALLWPGSLREVSFQLSFAAVLAIVLGVNRFSEHLTRWEDERLFRQRFPRWPVVRWLVLYVAVSVVASLGTAPLTAWHFNLLSPAGPLLNPLLVPWLAMLPVGLGLTAAFLVPVSETLAALPLAAAAGLVDLGDRVVAMAAASPLSALRVPTPSPFELGLVYAILLSCVVLRGRPRRAVLAVAAVLLLADVSYWAVHRHHPGNLRVTFVSVGQGDCTIVRLPDGRVMVVDGGGLSSTFDVGERVVAPQLWRRKVMQVSHLVLTHPDFDHYGGLAFLARQFAPREIWWNGERSAGPLFAATWEAMRSSGAEIRRMESGAGDRVAGVEIDVLAPGRRAPHGDNDRSLVLRLAYGGTRILLAGDIEEEGERWLVREHGDALRATILKVPHHGSRTSSTPVFLDAVAPRIAVVSVGYDNRFRQPAPSVLDAYRQRGSTVFRTDRDGAVTIDIDPHGTMDIHTAAGPSR